MLFVKRANVAQLLPALMPGRQGSLWAFEGSIRFVGGYRAESTCSIIFVMRGTQHLSCPSQDGVVSLSTEPTKTKPKT